MESCTKKCQIFLHFYIAHWSSNLYFTLYLLKTFKSFSSPFKSFSSPSGRYFWMIFLGEYFWIIFLDNIFGTKFLDDTNSWFCIMMMSLIWRLAKYLDLLKFWSYGTKKLSKKKYCIFFITSQNIVAKYRSFNHFIVGNDW